MDLNKFAKKITLKEGLKKSVSIAQVKEIMKLVLTELAKQKPLVVERLLKRYGKTIKK